MTYAEIMELPSETTNINVFELLKGTITSMDIKRGTNPDTFAHAHLIEWAIRNKKFVEYYSYIKQFHGEQDLWKAQEMLKQDKIVIVRFNYAATPLFGFYDENDGESALAFPDKDGMYCVYL